MSVFQQQWAKRRDFFGRLSFEIVIIFVGVTAAFALESARQERADAAYRESMIAAMVPTFDAVVRHNRGMFDEVEPKIAAFDRDLAAGKQPLLPIFRESGAERPPMRAWDGIVASGISRALPPQLYYELSQFYNRQESLGERYVRYAVTTEREVYPLGPDQAGAYDAASGKLKPQYAAFVDRLRDLIAGTKEIDLQAREMKAKVRALN